MTEDNGGQTFITAQPSILQNIPTIVCVLLIVIGNFIPWRCFSGFVTFCERGIEFSAFKTLFQNPDAVLASFGFLVLLALLLDRSNKFNFTLTWVVMGIFIAAVVGLNFYSDVWHGFGFYLSDTFVVVFSALSVLLLIRPRTLARYDKLTFILIVCLLLGSA